MTPRLVGLDVARGLAVLCMVQTHAYDGWLSPEARASTGFAVTRFFALLPLPLFLAIAGLNVGLKVRRAAHEGGSRRPLTRALLSQAARVILIGYALNALYAVLDGSRGIATFLRIDILHCIGLSVALLAACVGRPRSLERPVDARAFGRACLGLALLSLLICPPLSQMAQTLRDPLARLLLAPWLEVPGLSTMPVIPLVFFAASFAALGALVGWEALTGARGLAWLGATCLSALFLARWAELWLLPHGMPPSRTNPSIWFNALDLAARAGGVLGLTFLLTRARREDVPLLSLLGRHALLIYGLHLPFCYGSLASPLKRSTSFAEATLALAALIALCLLSALLREGRARSPARTLSLRP